ncbi:ABC transporter ATP-binding protein [Marisediminicola senii]|uniref:ABC transporter ATP-binding protein n=1 Tax=Marisediminicola senii TaxID=2711233 RepID=UPI0013ED2BD2|nr:ABC transporter ATP-binding protein [Marisediminicola senii]
MTLAIETSALTKRYGSTTALDGMDLAVPEGSIVGMIGPNGAGKTTTMRLLLDLIRPTSGTARVLGEDPRSGGPTLRRRIGFLPGELRLEGRVTGRAMLRHFERISGPVAPGRIDELADRFGLDLTRHVRKLSKGNKQKLGLVQAFMHSPPLLVLDEPTSGLDPLVQQEFLAMLREVRANGQTVFLSSHVLSEIEQVADTVAILRAGRIVTVSDVESLRLTAVRRVRLGVRGMDAAQLVTALAAVPHVSGIRVDAATGRAHLTVDGDIDPLIKAISHYEVTDLIAEEPDLEESVLGLYGTQEASHVD